MQENILKVENLKIDFKISENTFCAVNTINLKLKKNKTLGIVGESGSGKSVFSQSLLGLLPKNTVSSGKIIFENKDLIKLSNQDFHKIRGNNIAIIFQDHMAALNPLIKVGKQIREAILLHQNVSKLDAKRKTIEILKKVKFANPERIYFEYPHQLSGGMRPQFLKLINDLKSNFGTSVIMITHDLGVVAETSDDVAVMYAGRIVETASVSQIFNSPLHPYTIGLLSSIPTLNLKDKKLIGIEGNVPSLQNINTGCPFYSRCNFSKDICKSKFPEPENINGHIVYCHNFKRRD